MRSRVRGCAVSSKRITPVASSPPSFEDQAHSFFPPRHGARERSVHCAQLGSAPAVWRSQRYINIHGACSLQKLADDVLRICRDKIEIIGADSDDHHEKVAMLAISGFRMRGGAHLGSFIQHEILAPLDLTITAAAEALGMPRARLLKMLSERAHLLLEMALCVEKILACCRIRRYG